MPEVTIKINIGTNKMELSLDEAQELYGILDKFFGEKQQGPSIREFDCPNDDDNIYPRHPNPFPVPIVTY